MFPLHYPTDDPKWLHPRACKVCRKIKCTCDADDIKTRRALHETCTIAPALRVCEACKFEPSSVELEFAALRKLLVDVPPEPEYADLVAMAYMEHPDISREPADWPWTDDDYRDEILNHYPESGF